MIALCATETCTAMYAPELNPLTVMLLVCTCTRSDKLLEETLNSSNKSAKPVADMITENLVEFSQLDYNEHGSLSSINDIGYIYIPTSCRGNSNCKLHISFHGCKQNLQIIGDTYARYSGFNEWAEANNIIVLYPYVKPSLDGIPMNPKGCWDWWGYTNDEYGLKSGWQIQFVRKLIDAVVVS